MSDYIMELAKNPWARKIAGSLPLLPVSLPPVLNRIDEPWSKLEFSDREFLVTSVNKSDSAFVDSVISTISNLSGQVIKDPNDATDAAVEKLDGLVVDITDVVHPVDLEKVFSTVQMHMKKLDKCGRLVIAMADDHMTNALHFALVPFVKSLARELGRHGKTANLIFFNKDAPELASAACTWILSARSAFVSGQVIHLKHTDRHTDKQISQGELLAGRTAVITGASRGIGLAICQAFSREGAKVIGIDHPSEEQTLTEAMAALGAEGFVQDLTDQAAVSNIKELILSGPGQIDIMIHNAGITRDRTMAKMTIGEWEAVMKLNFLFPEKMSLELLKPGSAIIPLIKDGGRIITISSIVGIAGNFGQTNYAAAKGGVIGMTKDLQQDFPEIGINAIACGYIETNMTAKIPPLMREIARRMNALKQSGQPSDVAEAAVFLAGPLGSGISGQTLRVCGHHPTGA